MIGLRVEGLISVEGFPKLRIPLKGLYKDV